MASATRRSLHKSCRNRMGRIHKGNEPRSTKPARYKYDREGKLVGYARGHKGWGWCQFPSAPWKPYNLIGAKK